MNATVMFYSYIFHYCSDLNTVKFTPLLGGGHCPAESSDTQLDQVYLIGVLS